MSRKKSHERIWIDLPMYISASGDGRIAPPGPARWKGGRGGGRISDFTMVLDSIIGRDDLIWFDFFFWNSQEVAKTILYNPTTQRIRNHRPGYGYATPHLGGSIFIFATYVCSYVCSQFYIYSPIVRMMMHHCTYIHKKVDLIDILLSIINSYYASN